MSSRVTFTIDAIAYGGEALGRLETGEVCFVRGALPGETAEVEITERKKRFLRGTLTGIENPSSERISPLCPYADQCPGCSFQHCTYALELQWKQRQFERFLKGFPGERLPIFPSPRRFGWRNRLKVACEKGKAGYRGFDNTTLVPIEKCLLADGRINEAFQKSPIPDEGALFFRATPDWCGNVRDFTAPYLKDTIPGIGSFLVPPAGFFQTNPEVAAELCSRAVDAISRSGASRLLELFCGTGVFSIAATSLLPELSAYGIELAADSIKAAKLNAQNAALEERCRFRAADAVSFSAADGYDVLLVDPPRSGLEKKTVKKILASKIPLLLYISCGPDTLRRDLEMLAEKYEVLSSGALDMFPCTAHFETFTILNLSR